MAQVTKQQHQAQSQGFLTVNPLESFSIDCTHVTASLLLSQTGSQPSLDEVIQNLAASKSSQAKLTQCFLYMMAETIKKLAPSMMDVDKLLTRSSKPKAM